MRSVIPERMRFTAHDKMLALQRTDLFGPLSQDLLRKTADLSVIRNLAQNQILFSEHEQASALFVVARGQLRSVRQSVEGREQVLSTERPGAILAAVPVFSGGKFYSTMIADTISDVLCIEARHVHQLCHDHTELLWTLVRVLGRKVRHYAELIESLALRNVEQRLALHILNVAHERGVPFGQGCIVELTLTRTQMANRLGSAREVISRALTHLQKSGLMQMNGRRLITVTNMRALSAFAGTESDARPTKFAADLSSDIA
jgi:CRP/FNR family cyclic AMP-dependent transcriptional regulator